MTTNSDVPLADERPDVATHLSGVPNIEGPLDQWRQLREAIDGLDLDGAGDVSEAYAKQLDELLTYVERGLASADPCLISTNVVAAMGSALTTLISVMPRLAGSPEQVLGGMGQLADVVRDVLGVAGTSGRSAALDVEGRVRRAHANVTSDSEKLKSTFAKHDTALTNLAETFKEMLESADADVASARGNAVDQVNSFKETMKREVEEDRVEFVKYLESTRERGDDLVARLREQLAIAGDYSLSADYGNRAEDEEKAAGKLRIAAVAFGVLTVLAAIGAVVIHVWLGDNDDAGQQWVLWPGKLAAVVALGALARYLGSEAGRHRAYAQQLRAKQLQLQNLGPLPQRTCPAHQGGYPTTACRALLWR